MSIVDNDAKSLGGVVKDHVIWAGGLGFNSGAGQIKHSVVNGLFQLQQFFEAVFPGQQAAEMHTELAEWLVHWAPKLASRVRCSTRSSS